MEGSRIIIDPQTFNIYGTPGPSLGSLAYGTDSHADLADDDLLAEVPSVIYRATSQACRNRQNALANCEKRRKDSLSGDRNPASCLFTSTRTIFDNSTSQHPEF